ncbi:hypothetical protein LUZ60_007807 [Juncus effusus]|nr:hypothetical protein LUZ60_007807 [Juncus effusus]
MTPFKSPLFLLRLLSSPSPSSYLIASTSSPARRVSSLLFFSTRLPSGKVTASSEISFMEVVKEALKHASANQNKIALRSEQKSYTYSQLVSSALDISSTLRSNVENGARIGIAAKPSAEFVSAIWATWLSGGIAVPLALSYPEAELLHVMNDSDISMVLSSEEHQGIMKSISNQCSARFSLLPVVNSNSDFNLNDGEANSVSNLVEEVSKFKPQEGEVPALILYTSGTTGKPKGVVHTHKSILNQVQILTEAWEYTSTDQFLNCLPLHHILYKLYLFITFFFIIIILLSCKSLICSYTCMVFSTHCLHLYTLALW